ncbi:hypothetical protein [Labilibacter marinus]|uniref:hypothetical protein n=1 Tax=Labilibacter marinus TaxID=1477105 RepID=UPI00117A0E55|nr:hypothetical protein [Labilibacter marinus]
MSNIKNPESCTYKSLFQDQKVLEANIDFRNLYQKATKELLEFSIHDSRPKVIRNRILTCQYYSINILKQLHENAHHCAYKRLCLKHIIVPKINFHMEFLMFLKEQFPHYFDNEALIPLPLFRKCRIIYSHRLQTVIKQLESSSATNLLEIFITDVNTREYSFCECDSLKEIINIIYNQTDKFQKTEDSFLVIVKTLVAKCLYADSIFNFIIKEFSSEIKTINNPSLAIKQLKYLSKEINQVAESRSSKISLKQVLINWIKQELNYYKYSFHVADSAKIPEISVQSPPETIKVKTNITVGQMACFVHQLIETNIIETDNKKETIKMFSTVFTSKNSDSISEKSLINKFFNIDDKAAETTKQLFLDLFKSIRN